MSKRTPIIGGNWKMYTDLESGMLLAGEVADAVVAYDCCDVVVYPPFPYLQAIDSVLNQSSLGLGAQDIWFEESGFLQHETGSEHVQRIVPK